jgi:hypothetical protein
MKNPKARRVARVLTAQEKARLSRNRRRIEQEMPELVAGDQMRNEARNEPTLSGELRRAIHSSPMSLADIAAHAAVTPLALDEFLTGERTLRSDVLDRLATSLGLELSARN